MFKTLTFILKLVVFNVTLEGEFFKAKLLTALQTHITDIEYLSQTCQEDTDRLTEELKQCSSNNELLQPTGNIGLSIIRHVENARETDVCVGTSTSLGYITSNSCCQADEMFLFDLENSAEIKIEANSIWIEDHICFINTTETINVDVPMLDPWLFCCCHDYHLFSVLKPKFGTLKLGK